MTFRGFTSGGEGEDSNGEKKKAIPSTSLEPVRSASAARSQAIVGNGSKLIGSLVFAGQAEIDCAVEGEIDAPDTLIIGESAQIKARIQGGDIVVRGTVQGDITATKRITLKRPAKVAGNLCAPNLIVEEGVLFEGKCSMVSSQTSSVSMGSSLPNQTEVRGKISTPLSAMSQSKLVNQ